MNLLVTTVLFFFTELSVIADGRRKKSPNFLKYQDCGSNPDRPIQIVEIDARPLPIRSPGKLKLSATINITEPLPEHINVDVSISKYFLGMPFKIPCYHNIGTW
ncbi:hypothetical protein NP493_128g01020 [Ridgeia piscesae]|uniref:MD-2-related lipid-recognition domain-containing protein n=1 Tax=Ridgeia piscesae TaxID=27915 RepID=A0AAD9P5R9_RIDPI|nr:hypothetical protein NP493_128g01020 [Ridgeia piscesae]